jgi:hypothetical protein
VVARFSAPVQTGPEAHPASCTIGTGSSPGVKQPGRGVDHTTPSSAEVKERVELYLYSLWAFMACSRVTFTFIFTVRAPSLSSLHFPHLDYSLYAEDGGRRLSETLVPV